ncbi:FUSC family protein [Salinicola socius]|uniref:Integral membrane bound transporter domain-containing protein n=1 Tax=Salinicola socius TaxID=404433 RepID=A0A1Q8SXR1_9GAMM|nr:FUSC family protein [Salinicola socius]OLO06224.1 hypothetical protein BTW07_01660 [Salinicola socius]
MIASLGPRNLARIRSALLVARCTAAAILSYAVADALGLGHPVWAVVSALIVSQETARETRRSFLWRGAGTLIGTGAALPAAVLLMPDPAHPLTATGAAVAICAAIARRWPRMRVCLWTAPLVILTATTDHSILYTAAQRSGEVLLGGMVGAAIHLLLDYAVIRRLAQNWNDRDDATPMLPASEPAQPEVPASGRGRH